jgi:lysophospholipase L1-like esterase
MLVEIWSLRVLVLALTTVLISILAGIYFQREIGVGTFLKRIGLIRPDLIAADLSPRFNTLRARGIPEGAVVFLGDSLIDHQEWHEVLPGELVVNRGVSGARVDDFQGVFDLKPAKFVFCLIGANDIGAGVSVEEFSKRYERLAGTIPHGTRFYAISIPAIRNYGQIAINQETVRACNTKIKQIAIRNGFKFIDIYNESMESQSRFFERDGLHLSPYGYELLIRELKAVLAANRI